MKTAANEGRKNRALSIMDRKASPMVHIINLYRDYGGNLFKSNDDVCFDAVQTCRYITQKSTQDQNPQNHHLP